MTKREAARSAQHKTPTNERADLRQWIPVAVVLLAAIAFRVVYLLQYRAHVPYYSVPIVDSYVYDAWAQRVAAGQGYGDKPFYMAPLYPYLLALLFKIAGHKLALVYISQAALGVVTLLLIYMLGRRTFGHAAGVIAMVLVLLYAPLVYLETKVLTETLAVTLNLASILLVMRALDKQTAARFLVAGLALGLSIICRPAALITAALIGVWMILPSVRSRYGIRLQSPALVLLGIAVTILPITIRNYVVGHDFAVISTNAGIVFAQGNNAGSKGFFTALPGFSGSVQVEQEESTRLAVRALGRPVTQSELSSYWLGYGLKFIRENPGAYALLLARKLTWSLHNGESACIYNVYLEKQLVPALRLLITPFSVLIGFGIYGIAISMRKRDAQLLALAVLSVYISLMVFSVSSRYRVPVSAPLAVFAGFGISRLFELISSRDFRGIGVSAACIAPVFLISLIPYPKAYITAEAPANLGFGYFMAGRTDEAIVQLQRAVDMDPGFTYPHLLLGRALARQGKYEEAVGHYETVIGNQPDNADAHYFLANALVELGRTNEAIVHYADTVRLQPANVEAHFNLGVLNDGREKFQEAIRQYRAAIDLRPDYADAHNNLAIDLYTVGRYADAWQEARLCRQYGGTPHPGFIKALEAKMPEPR